LDFKFHAIAYRSVAGVNRVVLGGWTRSNDIVFLDSTKSEVGAGVLISLDADTGEVYWSIGVKR
jgi:outer membrane protein assembly factor BamB